MATFSLKIIATDKTFYNDKCYSIIVPALDGEKEIMAHHEDMVVATKEGEIRFKEDEASEWRFAAVGTGFVHIANNRVTMVVDTAERPEDIDVVRAERALKEAEEELRQIQSIEEHHVSQTSLARAMVRIKAARKIK